MALAHAAFQMVFGMIMTLLIALELEHSIVRVDDSPDARGLA